ncbi:MAG: helix-turn-helix domain-containing protein [Reyranellaceae bacterium]
MNSLRVRYYHPDETLRPYISSYSLTDVVGDTPPALLQPGWANLRFTLIGRSTVRLGGTERSSLDTPARVCGPTSRAYEITGYPSTRGIGVGLLPLGWAHFIGQPAHRFADRVESLDAVLGDDAEFLLRALREVSDDEALRAVLDMFFLRLHAARPAPSSYLIRAHELLLDPDIATAEQVAVRLGLSTRHVARLSLDMFGFTPKLLLRRQRFLRTLGAIMGRPPESWAAVLDETYYDQSHFVHDCHRFLGMPPSAFFARQRAFFDLVTGLRREAIGQPLQGLHPVVETP